MEIPGSEGIMITEEPLPLSPPHVTLAVSQPQTTDTAIRHNNEKPPDSTTTTTSNNKRHGRRRLQWIVSDTTHRLTHAQETMFLNMQVRKMRRRVHGRKTQGSIGRELCFLILLIVFIMILSIVAPPPQIEETSPSEIEESTPPSEIEESPPSSSTTSTQNATTDSPTSITEEEMALGVQEIQVIGIIVFLIWILFAFVILTLSQGSVWMRMLKWMLFYIPVLWAVLDVAIEVDFQQTAGDEMFVLFILLECLVFVTFVGFYKLYPIIIRLHCFQNNAGRVAWLWRVGAVSDWTMTYGAPLSCCRAMYACKYEGETCPSSGLPHGPGRWLDDAWEGEMITGFWKQGHPVAPFSSWSYGTDDAVTAVRVAYFNATDDPYASNAFFASNEQSTPSCGVASVECSISGSFFKHLPEATLLEGPFERDTANVVDGGTTTETGSGLPSSSFDCYQDAIRKCMDDLNPIKRDYDVEQGMPTIEIRATDVRGVQVIGHMYGKTKRFFANPESITVEVNRSAEGSTTTGGGRTGQMFRRPAMRFPRRSLFLPKASTTSNRKIVMVDMDSDSDDSGSEGDFEEEKEEESQGLLPEPAKPTEASIRQSTTSRLSLVQKAPASLRVKDWFPATQKEALIFLPGYNSTTKQRLQNFGQFLAMSKLVSHVYPFVYLWPGGKGPGYFQASHVSGTIKNFDNLRTLVSSIRAAGIHTVHFMTHSMGAQTLLGSFKDKYNEKGERQGRSDISLCFQLDPSFSDEDHSEDKSNSGNKLICKTITMLNPDFPLEAFVDRGFHSLRRICHTITVVGDRNDGALWWSSLFNGIAARFGYEHWDALQPQIPPSTKRSFHLQERIGRSINSLHFPAGKNANKNTDKISFQERTSLVGAAPDLDENTPKWLDMDVVDMTGLDTNIAGLRHSGFSLNGMLLKDLAEVITTGRRAMRRSTLVYRDGNMFSYANAPSFVSL